MPRRKRTEDKGGEQEVMGMLPVYCYLRSKPKKRGYRNAWDLEASGIERSEGTTTM